MTRPQEALGPFADAHINSPIGALRLIASPRGIVEIVFLDDDPNPAHARLHRSDAERLGPVRPIEEMQDLGTEGALLRQHLDLATSELIQYFAGEILDFTVSLDFALSTGFYLEAREALRDIPYGEVATYGEVAEMTGRPRAARAVGTACANNPIPIIVPYHRVVPASGGIGAYGGGEWIKETLLRLEGARLP